MKIPKFNIDSLERVMKDNANKREALKAAFAARLEKERHKTKAWNDIIDKIADQPPCHPTGQDAT